MNFIENLISRYITKWGQFLYFVKKSFSGMHPKRLYFNLLLNQMEFVGNQSLMIIILAAFMVGAVFGLQFGQIFKIFGVEPLIGAAASFALSKELAPVVGAFLVTGRAGASMTAEIATMRVNEQIDAMKVLSINPITYLISPRVLASMLMMPLLTGVFVMAGVFSSLVIGITLYDIDVGVFMDKIIWITKPSYLFQGLQKSIVFGWILSTICCYTGFYAKGGAKGVGEATTFSVVTSLVSILICDFFISYLQLKWGS